MTVSEMESNIQNEEKIDNSKSDDLKPITIEILRIIKDSHQQHGLRHGDYQRYRGYCSRRIARLRKVLKLPQGDRRHFKRRDVTEAHVNHPKADERNLQLPLMLAERNWAYAMQLRQEANTEPRKKFHLVQKLRKACTYALLLEELCQLERCDARTKLESQAYVAWMHGSLHFELQLWPTATEHLTKAKVIYEKLAAALPEDEQLPYNQRVEEIVPSLRYCAYNLGEGKDGAVDLLQLRSQGILDHLDALVSQTKERSAGATVLHEVTWFGAKVPIRLERVRLFLMGIEPLDKSISAAEGNPAKIKILEDMFIDLRDVIAVVRDEVRGDNKEQILLHYLLATRIERTVHRNLLLIPQTRRPQDICRLLDICFQQLTELTLLDSVKDNDSLQEHYVGELAAVRILRSFYMGRVHAQFRRWAEAAIVLERCLEKVNNLAELKYNDEKYGKLLKEQVDMVKERVEVDKCIAQAQVVLEVCDEDIGKKQLVEKQKVQRSKKPLCERLDEFREDPQLLTKNPNVVTLPPAMVPIPAKPLFYDLALNFIQMPSLQDKIELPGQKQQNKSGAAGISGFVKGLFWGKK